jgi:DNA mismatch repair protein MutL
MLLDTPSIKILDNLVIDQIAAGEVVERPSAIVKELVENAIDAKSSEIHIEIENGGIDSITIIDNGIGMNKADLRLCIERFGTSKISAAEDLENIASYGFRGEALPSIASVSKLTITTRKHADVFGHLLTIEGGSEPEIVKFDTKEGTRIQVKDLFYNIPARRKFLKSARSESNQIRTVISDFAFARPDIHFFYFEDGQEVQVYPGRQTLLDRVMLSKLVQGKPIEVNYSTSNSEGREIKVEGYITEPIFASRGGSKIRLLVNGRLVKSALLVRALRDAYGSFLRPGYYPSGVIRLYIDPREVDVNVHPQKTEVRFREEGQVFVALREAVSRALLKAGESREHTEQKSYQLGNRGISRVQEESPVVEFRGQGSLFELADTHEERNIGRESNLRFVGQIFSLYLLFEEEDSFLILDMHAGHERVTFYNLKKAFKEKSLGEQLLLVPELIPIGTFDNISNLEEKLDVLKKFGLELELRMDEVVIRSVPQFLDMKRAKDIVKSVLEFLPDKSLQALIEEKTDQIITLMACHGSLRRGKIISAEEAYALLEQIREIELGAWCPHGRPVIWIISEMELEKKFGRIQS